MNDEPKYEPYETQDIFKRYENYTFKKRLANAQHCLFNKDKTCSVRISDFFFSLFVSKQYLKKIFDNEYKRAEEANKCLKKSYDEIVNDNFDDVAYVIFTSGSTGEPKGVVIEQQAVVNTIIDINERFQVKDKDRKCL